VPDTPAGCHRTPLENLNVAIRIWVAIVPPR
jgi:hypothetical protein